MSLTLPRRDNGYAIPLDADATRALFEAVFGDVHARLNALELTEADYQAAIDAITTQALEIVSANITDEVEAQRLVLAQIEETAAQILAEYEDLVANGSPASASSLAPIEGFAPTNVQAAVEAILTAMAANAQADDTRLDAIEADDWVTRARIADAVFATPAEIRQAADKAVTASAENTANAIYDVPFASTITLDGNNGRVQRITATGNFTLGLPTNLKNGRYELEVVSSGGLRTMSFATGWRFAKGKLATLTQVSGAVDVFLIRPNGSTPAIVPTAFLDLKAPV